MTTFLLLISLLLNGVAIFFIIILYTRQNRLAEAEKRQEKLIRDVEEIISSSLYEMKEENEAFIEQFKKVSTQTAQCVDAVKQPVKKEIKLEAGNVPNSEPLNKEIIEKTGTVSKKQAMKAYQNNTQKEKLDESFLEEDLLKDLLLKDKIELPKTPSETIEDKTAMTQEEIYRDLFMNQVLILQKQGLMPEEIAKKLGKGKTEIELLLKFGQKQSNT